MRYYFSLHRDLSSRLQVAHIAEVSMLKPGEREPRRDQGHRFEEYTGSDEHVSANKEYCTTVSTLIWSEGGRSHFCRLHQNPNLNERQLSGATVQPRNDRDVGV
jgi:hypothetical protein